MESDEEYNERYQHEVNGKPLPATPKKMTVAMFIKMVKAGKVPGIEWNYGRNENDKKD